MLRCKTWFREGLALRTPSFSRDANILCSDNIEVGKLNYVN